MGAAKLGKGIAGNFAGALGLARVPLVVYGELFVSFETFPRIAEQLLPMRVGGGMIALSLRN